ncbi:O-methyltransferase [Plectosphaerella plurivora]|uniref:O-methyltransferase n=1 Tax=Plectosphaerella plurivora TaxID=936078 RepID=A0A9P9ACQ0_9PEZI|nr:O-methyltransferase [Plectosphaerella plurivora]
MTLTTTTSSFPEANPFHDLTPALVDAVRQFDAAANTDQETAVRDSIVNAAQAIIDAARPPQPQWMNQSAACAEFVALRLFIEWGAFEAIPLEGNISYEALAEKIDADMQLVRRFAWIMVSTGLLIQVGTDDVAHTDKSRQITQTVPLRAMWQLMFNNSFMGSAIMPRYFAANGRREPRGPTNVPYTVAHLNPDKTFWEVLNADPYQMRVFMEAMTAVGKDVPLMGPITGLYDLSRLAAPAAASDPARTLLVDVGGGKGHAITALCSAPGSPLTTDRCVLQDVPPVIAAVSADTTTTSAALAGTTLQAIDFHKEQPVRGALVYYIRHCLHNYGDPEVIGILRHTAAAMADDSVLLVAEYVMSNPPSKFAVWMDFIMCMSGGKERTRAMWQHVAAEAGLEIATYHGLDRSPDGHAVIEFVKRRQETAA